MSKKYDNKNNLDNHKVASKKKYINKEKMNLIPLLPLLFTISVLPLIVRMKDYKTHLSQFSWFAVNDMYTDFFLYYKQWTFIILTAIMVSFLIYYRYKNKISFEIKPIFIPLIIYAALSLLSSLITKYRYYSFAGVFEQFESIFVILGYCILVYYAFCFVKSEKDVKLIINILLLGVLIISLLGILQFIGHDFLATKVGLKLIVPRSYWNSLDDINITIGNVYLTLYNPNYVGVYVSLLLPIILVLAFFTKNIKLITLYALCIIGLIISLIGSKSTSGLIGLFFSFLFMFILFRRIIFKYYYIFIALFIIAIVSIFFINNKNHYFLNQVHKITNIDKTAEPNIRDIQTRDDLVEINYKGNIMHISFFIDEANNYAFNISDDANTPIPTSFDGVNSPITIQDNRFPGFVITPSIYDNIPCFGVRIEGITWNFTNKSNDGTYYLINKYGRLDKIKTAESVSFLKGYETFASSRGYIWSRTIPLLKDHIILGSGANTFVLDFPQQDYVNLYNYGFGTQLLTKPHNSYLQTAVQTGVLSLIALIIFYLFYFISSLKLYYKKSFESYYSKVGVAVLVGTFSYLITGLTNDSSITVAPIFWAIIGLGIAVNEKVKLNAIKKY